MKPSVKIISICTGITLFSNFVTYQFTINFTKNQIEQKISVVNTNKDYFDQKIVSMETAITNVQKDVQTIATAISQQHVVGGAINMKDSKIGTINSSLIGR